MKRCPYRRCLCIGRPTGILSECSNAGTKTPGVIFARLELVHLRDKPLQHPAEQLILEQHHTLLHTIAAKLQMRLPTNRILSRWHFALPSILFGMSSCIRTEIESLQSQILS